MAVTIWVKARMGGAGPFGNWVAGQVISVPIEAGKAMVEANAAEFAEPPGQKKQAGEVKRGRGRPPGSKNKLTDPDHPVVAKQDPPALPTPTPMKPPIPPPMPGRGIK